MRKGLILLCALAWCLGAFAQTKPEPPRRPTPVPADRKDTVAEKSRPLPQIELPEYDITGTLVPGVAGSNKEGAGGEGALDPLGVKNLRGREPQWLDEGMWKLGAGPSVGAGVRAGRVSAGVGSFKTPVLDLWVNPGIEDLDLGLRAGYRSSTGHVENAGYRRGFASLALGRALGDSSGLISRSSLRASITYAGHSYTPYGALVPVEERTLDRFSSSLMLSDVRVGETLLEGGVFVTGSSLADRATTRLTRFGARLRGARSVRALSVEWGGELVLSQMTGPASDQNPLFIRTSLVLQGQVHPDVILRGGVAGYIARGSSGSSLGYLYPLASVSWYPADPLELFIRYEPSVTERTLGDLVDAGPYVREGYTLRHEVVGTDLVAGMGVMFGRSLHVRLSTRYQRISSALLFVDTARVGLWDPWYDGVSTVFTGQGDLTWQMTDADLFTATVRALVSDNSATEEKLPYLAPLRIDGSYGHWFPFGLLLTGDVEMVGERSPDLLASRTLKSFVLLNLSAEYGFLPGWRVMGRVDNLLGARSEWWEGYVAPPRTGWLGLAYSW
jgi:hypothetical protein